MFEIGEKEAARGTVAVGKVLMDTTVTLQEKLDAKYPGVPGTAGNGIGKGGPENGNS